MSNHAIECRHCGRDQRTFGLHCCATAERADIALRHAYAEEQARRRELFNRHGISYSDRGEPFGICPDAASVSSYLTELETRDGQP